MKRKYPSGAQKNKMKAKAKLERAKLPKITSLFQQAAKVSADASAVSSPPGPATTSNSSESRQPSSPVTAEPASRASRLETGQQEVSCAPSKASSDIAQPASRAPTGPSSSQSETAAPAHPRDTLASDNSVTEYPTDRGKFPVDLEDDNVKRYILNNGPCKPEGPFKRDGKDGLPITSTKRGE
ncbi:hypothetical protein SKAU_G00208010 [Synaphobranchus kaupii]|uniref:Uncharacterized protein n=1 Tax=Synaphobranchus kaupii TaxID=118154 RepID=A0A9Q1F8C3_SYNKA|nr:hypothetical protein SKAU_G00208010 [Synaphobranchus kaupii]